MVPEREEREKGSGNLFEEIIASVVLEMEQESRSRKYWEPKQGKPKEVPTNNIIVKMPKLKTDC